MRELFMTLNKKHNAFTLMEIMIAVFIIGLLASVAVPGLMKMLGRGQVGATQSTLASLKSAITTFKMDVGRIPNTKEGLKALITPKANAPWKGYQGPYLEGVTEIPMDSWQNEFEYNCPPQRFRGKYQLYEIISYGEKGKDVATEEDILHTGA
jgi:general secretion pathway protein G